MSAIGSGTTTGKPPWIRHGQSGGMQGVDAATSVLNTQLATVLLRRINGTANNSANYLKRLPIVSPSEIELAKANELISTAISEVLEHNSLSESIAQEIEEFYRTVWCDG